MSILSLIPMLKPPAQDANPGSQFLTIGLIVVLFALYYFFISRPQRAKQKEEQAKRESVKKGDKIVSIGGIHGQVVIVKEKTIVITINNQGTRMELSKRAVASVSSEPDELDLETADVASEKENNN